MEVPGLAPTSAQPWDLARGEPDRRSVVTFLEDGAHNLEELLNRAGGIEDRLVLGADLPVGGEAPRAVGAELALVVRLLNSIVNQNRWVEKSRASLVVTHSAGARPGG